MQHIADQQFLADVALGKGDLDIPRRICAARHIAQQPAARQVYAAIQHGDFGSYSNDCLDALMDGLQSSLE